MARLRSIFGLLLIAAMLYAAWSVVPPYYANRQLQQFATDVALQESYSSKTENDIAQSLAAKAQELGVPLTEEQFQVQKSEGKISISAEYTQHVDLKVRAFDLNFKVGTQNQRAQGL